MVGYSAVVEGHMKWFYQSLSERCPKRIGGGMRRWKPRSSGTVVSSMWRGSWGAIPRPFVRVAKILSPPRIRWLTGFEKRGGTKTSDRDHAATRTELAGGFARAHGGRPDACGGSLDQSVAQRDGPPAGRARDSGGKTGVAAVAQAAGLSEAEGSQNADNGLASRSRCTV